MVRIILTDKTGERFTVDTTSDDYAEGVDATGMEWWTTDGEHWESDLGEEASR